jgi:hypothetical protein
MGTLAHNHTAHDAELVRGADEVAVSRLVRSGGRVVRRGSTALAEVQTPYVSSCTSPIGASWCGWRRAQSQRQRRQRGVEHHATYLPDLPAQ